MMGRLKEPVTAARNWAARLWVGLRARFHEPPLSIAVMVPGASVRSSWLHGIVNGYSVEEDKRTAHTCGEERSQSQRLSVRSKAIGMPDDGSAKPQSNSVNASAVAPMAPAEMPLFAELQDGRAKAQAEIRFLEFPEAKAGGASAKPARTWSKKSDLEYLQRADSVCVFLDPSLYVRQPEAYEALGLAYKRLLSEEPVAGGWDYVARALDTLSEDERHQKGSVRACLKSALSLVFGPVGGLGIEGDSQDAFLNGLAERVVHEPDPSALEGIYLDMVFELLVRASSVAMDPDSLCSAAAQHDIGHCYDGLRERLRTADTPEAIRNALETYFDRLYAYPPELHAQVMRTIGISGYRGVQADAHAGARQAHKVAVVVPAAERLPGFVEAAALGQQPYRLVPPVLAVRLGNTSDWEAWSEAVHAYWRETSTSNWAATVEWMLHRSRPYLEPILPLLGSRAQVFFLSSVGPDKLTEASEAPLSSFGIAQPLVWALEPGIEAGKRAGRRTGFLLKGAGASLVVGGTYLGMYGYAEWLWREAANALSGSLDACTTTPLVSLDSAGDEILAGSPRTVLPDVERTHKAFARACERLTASESVPLLGGSKASERLELRWAVCNHAEQLDGYAVQGVPIGLHVPRNVGSNLLCHVNQRTTRIEHGMVIEESCSAFRWLPGWSVRAVSSEVPAVAEGSHKVAKLLWEWALWFPMLELAENEDGDFLPFATMAVVYHFVSDYLLNSDIPHATVTGLVERVPEMLAAVEERHRPEKPLWLAPVETVREDFLLEVSAYLVSNGVSVARAKAILDQSILDYPVAAGVTDARAGHLVFISDGEGMKSPLSLLSWGTLNRGYRERICGPDDLVSRLQSQTWW